MSIFVMASASYDLDYALNNTNRINLRSQIATAKPTLSQGFFHDLSPDIQKMAGNFPAEDGPGSFDQPK